jgi:2,5-furandicarboxylate decarboxylase 1
LKISEYPYDNLKDFMAALSREGDLIEIEDEVNCHLEIAAILEALGQRNGPAAVFKRVKNHSGTMVAGNIMGHRRRVAKVMGVSVAEMGRSYLARRTQRIAPVDAKAAPVRDFMFRGNEIDVARSLPALVHHEKDTSPYMTCAVTFAKDPRGGGQSIGLHRIQVRSERTLAICLLTPPLSRFLQEASNLGKPLEVAVVLGPDPAVLIASVTICPEGEDKIEIAGAMRQKPVEMIKCQTVDLRVPAYAQYVLEGTIQPGNQAREGTFGESSGIYVHEIESPLIDVKVLYHQQDPVYQALQPWSSEDNEFFNLCFGSDILARIQRDFPFVRDIYLAPGTVSGIALMSVNASSPTAMVRSAVVATLTASPFVKIVIAVDEDIDVREHRQIDWAVATRFQANRDLIILPDVYGSDIDPSAFPGGASCKVGFDATVPRERREAFERISIPIQIQDRAREVLSNASKGTEAWEGSRFSEK